jgi:hypothetical protein
MNTFFTDSSAADTRLRSVRAPVLSPFFLRTLLSLGCAAAVALSMASASVHGGSQAYLASEPGLATLLRAMAGIKALIGIATVGLLVWRFGYSIRPRRAAAYLLGAWLIIGAAVLIWELTSIPLAALAFHVGLFAVLLAAFGDRTSGAFTSRRSPAPP